MNRGRKDQWKKVDKPKNMGLGKKNMATAISSKALGG
jgi:hypothetical protein